jgi:purine-binding chemotaxis protein CheW
MVIGPSRQVDSLLPFLVCRSGPRFCALALADVVETMRPLPVEPVAEAPPFLKGIAIVRGEALPVVDIGRLVNGESEARIGRFVTVRLGRRHAVFAVGEVTGIREMGADALSEARTVLGDLEPEVIASLGRLDGQLVSLLRAAPVISDELWGRLDQQAAHR